MSDLMTGTRTANRDYLAEVNKRIKSVEDFKAQLAQKRTDPAYANKIPAIDSANADADKALEALKKEREVRQRIEDGYAQSSSKTPDTDPAVKAALADLTAHRSKNYPAYYAGGQKVGNPCLSCMGNKVDPPKAAPVWVRYGKGGGPMYKATHQNTMASFSGWDDLINSKVKTESEKKALIAMSGNEGEFDQPQSYDSEAVSMGVMQKTVNSEGTGELPKQIAEFRSENPAKYKSLFEDKGWSVVDTEERVVKGQKTTVKVPPKLYFKDPDDPNMKPVTGSDLKTYIRQKDQPERWTKTLGPLREAGQDVDFQKKQVMDFNNRLIAANGQKPTGYDQPINKYITSEKGSAAVLDQSVNRPAYVKTDMGKALDQFYAKNPKASKDPTTWTAAQRAEYEPQIMDNYKSVRRMVDSDKRWAHIMGDSSVSGSPGSMKWP